MASHFGWIDFSEKERQQMMNVVRFFQEKETRDELGIGTIRDAFADYFFPGTSTIQTRARYMLLIPWMYKELEQKKIQFPEITKKARQEEVTLILNLLRNGEKDGVIGQDSKEKLKRLPSSIYWVGLGLWGIRRFPGSQDQYHRSLNTYYKWKSGRGIEEETGYPFMENWDPGLPEPPKNFKEKATLLLTKKEAEYLQHKILCGYPNTLLAVLVSERDFIETDFLWENSAFEKVSESLLINIEHARNFSEIIYGAVLLYNLYLARSRGNQDWVDNYESRVNDWAFLIESKWEELLKWYQDIEKFWFSNPLKEARVTFQTRIFIDRWLQLIFQEVGLKGVIDHPSVYQFIKDREIRLKRSLARLENPRALENWNGSSGDFQLNYRWRITKVLVKDILDGLYGLSNPGKEDEVSA
ncbi:MAG TPA: DUF6361 family protein [Bacillota bacterium]|nr:DUF6361 family protein [Bacillota bacterium]